MGTRTSWDYRHRFRAGFATVSRWCHPIALALAGARSAETVEHRASDAPSRSSVGPSARCSDGPSRTFAAAVWCNKSGVPVPARLHRCPSHRRPSSELSLDPDPRIGPPASAILTTHGHVRRSSHPDCTALRPLAPVRVRYNNFRCCCQTGLIQRAIELAVAIFQSFFSPNSQGEINENRLWKMRFFFHS